jgi:hypothetical protein
MGEGRDGMGFSEDRLLLLDTLPGPVVQNTKDFEDLFFF